MKYNQAEKMEIIRMVETYDLPVIKTGLNKVHVKVIPRLLSDNGPCYLSHHLRDYLSTQEIRHSNGASY